MVSVHIHQYMACISLLPHVLSLQILQRVYWQTKVAYNASSYGVMDPNATFAISEPQQLANIALFAISRRSPREWSLTRIWHTRSHSSSVPAATSWSAIFGIYVITWLWYTINSVVLLSARNSSVLDATTGPRPMSDDKSTTTSNCRRAIFHSEHPFPFQECLLLPRINTYHS